ncbi:hypothetical protein HDE_00939 [Halotydeus destructor]|nr:hypothetical protein HDE_00939 [Halotydeus destructor]
MDLLNEELALMANFFVSAKQKTFIHSYTLSVDGRFLAFQSDVSIHGELLAVNVLYPFRVFLPLAELCKVFSSSELLEMIEEQQQSDLLAVLSKYECRKAPLETDHMLKLLDSESFISLVEGLFRECSILKYDFSSSSHYIQLILKMQLETERKSPVTKALSNEAYLKSINLQLLRKPVPDELENKVVRFTESLKIDSFTNKSVVETLFLALESLESIPHRNLRLENYRAMEVTVLGWTFSECGSTHYAANSTYVSGGHIKHISIQLYQSPQHEDADLKELFVSRYGGFSGSWLFQYQGDTLVDLHFLNSGFGDTVSSIAIFDENLDPVELVTDRIGLLVVSNLHKQDSATHMACTRVVAIRFGLNLPRFNDVEDLWSSFVYPLLSGQRLLVVANIHVSDHLSLSPMIRGSKVRLRGSEFVYIPKLNRHLNHCIKNMNLDSSVHRAISFQAKLVFETLDFEMVYGNLSAQRAFSRATMHSKISGDFKPGPQVGTSKIQGGTFACNKSGHFRNVTSVDIRAMYPTIALHLDSPQWLRKSLSNLLQLIVGDSLNAKHYKKLATASVGVLGCRTSPLFDPATLSEITKHGREAMSRIREIFTPTAVELLVATDGGVFSGPNIETLVKTFNSSSYLELRIQGRYKHMILVNNNLYVLLNSISDYVVKDSYFSRLQHVDLSYARSYAHESILLGKIKTIPIDASSMRFCDEAVYSLNKQNVQQSLLSIFPNLIFVTPLSWTLAAIESLHVKPQFKVLKLRLDDSDSACGLSLRDYADLEAVHIEFKFRRPVGTTQLQELFEFLKPSTKLVVHLFLNNYYSDSWLCMLAKCINKVKVKKLIVTHIDGTRISSKLLQLCDGMDPGVFLKLFYVDGSVQATYECEVLHSASFPPPACSILRLYLDSVLPFISTVNDIMYEPIESLSNFNQLRRFNPKLQHSVKRKVTSACSIPQNGVVVVASKIDGASGFLQLDRIDALLFKATVVSETLSSFWFGLLDTVGGIDFNTAVFQIEILDQCLVIVDWLTANNSSVRIDHEFYLDFPIDSILAATPLHTNFTLCAQSYFGNASQLSPKFVHDGILAIAFTKQGVQFLRIKPIDTVELIAVENAVLQDLDSNKYISNKTTGLTIGQVYECSFETVIQSVEVIRPRGDRIYPNSRSRILQAFHNGQISLPDSQNGCPD